MTLWNQTCPQCGSRKAGTIYDDGSFHCHKCKHNTHAKKEGPLPKMIGRPAGGYPMIELGEVKPLTKRKISLETCEKFGYSTGICKGETVQVAVYRDSAGKPIAQHIRFKNKDFVWRGDAEKAKLILFGRHLWRDKGKMIVITEGEIDAMSVSQLQGNKYPVVSVPNGAQSADDAIRANIDWLEQFDRVVFMLDNDEAGKKAAQVCAGLISPGKAFIADLPLKDANDMLRADRGKEVIDAIWGAKEFRPDGILCGSELWEAVNDTSAFESTPYPWAGLNRILRGLRKREVCTFAAGTGVGKSEVVRQIAAHMHDHEDQRIGYIALEESKQRTALGFIGLELGQRLHVDGVSDVPQEELKKAFEKTIGSGRYFLYDHWGSLDRPNLISRVRYFARGCKCSVVVIDHISIVVSGLEIDDERKAIDVLMTDLRSLAEELAISLIVICHVRRIDGKSHEEGAQMSLAHLRGSGAIAQLSDTVVGLERDQQDEDNPNVTTVRVLKNRHTGETGVACYLNYDTETGRLTETEQPEEPDEEAPFETTKQAPDPVRRRAGTRAAR
jgi:twinkle protein